DANAALEIVSEYDKPAAVAVKHMNPCGIGLADDISGAFNRAYAADPISISGGIIACNREVDEATAQQMNEIFLEIIIAPNFTKEALNILREKKNIRLIKMDVVDEEKTALELKTVKGGLLIQTNDDGKVTT